MYAQYTALLAFFASLHLTFFKRPANFKSFKKPANADPTHDI